MQTQADLSRAAFRAKHGREADKTFLTGPQVQARYGRSHVTLWRWVRDTDLGFPQPMQINRLNYWRLSDLEAWEAAQAGQTAA